MPNFLSMSSSIETDLLLVEFTFKWRKNKSLGCFILILLVDVKAFPLAPMLSESENDLEEDFSFTLCGHATLFNAERIVLVQKVAPLLFKCKPS